MEVFRALAALAEPPEGAGLERLAAALGLGPLPAAGVHTEVFVFQLAPYASVYLGAEGMLGGEARDRVAGFWRALGQAPPAEADHLTSMLALYARLAEFEAGAGEAGARRAGWRRARKAFLWEHLLSWLPVYLDKLARLAPPFYRRWGELLACALAEEAVSLGAQGALPLHLREAPALLDPREHAVEDFLQSLLAPARSGMILTRADLGRAARALGLSLRAGERKFVLKALLNQDAAGVFGWLAGEAASWASRHGSRRAAHGPVAEWWEQRAANAATVLGELQAEVNDRSVD